MTHIAKAPMEIPCTVAESKRDNSETPCCASVENQSAVSYNKMFAPLQVSD